MYWESFLEIILSNSGHNFLESTLYNCFYVSSTFRLPSLQLFHLLSTKSETFNYNLELEVSCQKFWCSASSFNAWFPTLCLVKVPVNHWQKFHFTHRTKQPLTNFYSNILLLNSDFYPDKVHIFHFLNLRVEWKTGNFIFKVKQDWAQHADVKKTNSHTLNSVFINWKHNRYILKNFPFLN